MKDFIESFMEKPLGFRVACWIITLGLAGYLLHQNLYVGQAEELSVLATRIEGLQTEIATERRLAQELPKVKEIVKELDLKLNAALKELPDKSQIPDLLASVSTLAKDAGLEVSLFKPRPENFRDFYAEVPVSISVDGTYHQVATFFDEVGRLERIVNISEIAMKESKVSPGDKMARVKTSCTATTFRYLDEAERQKLMGDTDESGAPGAKKSRKR